MLSQVAFMTSVKVNGGDLLALGLLEDQRFVRVGSQGLEQFLCFHAILTAGREISRRYGVKGS